MSLAQSQIDVAGGHVMSEVTGYAQILRALGQALETLNIQSFELEPVGEEFLVRGKVALASASGSDDQRSRRRRRRASWGVSPKAKETGDDSVRMVEASATSPVELQYTSRDLERLEYEGQLQRTDANRVAETASLSQTLRCIGAYLNQKRARLLKVARDGEAVLLEYETSLGSQIKESFALSGLYDLWVRMYLQRAGRVS
jgi:hypothetical protein